MNIMVNRFNVLARAENPRIMLEISDESLAQSALVKRMAPLKIRDIAKVDLIISTATEAASRQD